MENDPKKQKRLGPAPFASFEKSFEDSNAAAAAASASAAAAASNATISEDVSEKNMESTNSAVQNGKLNENVSDISLQRNTKGDKAIPVSSGKKLRDIGGKRSAPIPLVNQLQNEIHKISTLNTPLTPRIELSRASSSSHHEEDSRESSPDNVFEQVGTGTLQEAICLGFREDGALELRSSTEELYFMEPDKKKEEQDKFQQTQKSPVVFKFDEHQSYLQHHQRKDSASSEVAALLCISGRTSRISSVGSQGSAVSRLSAVSAVSRSPSPHRMLLETSFCGPKPLENIVDGSIASYVEFPAAEALEQLILTRKHDPTQAVMAEGIKIESSPKKNLMINGEAKRKSQTLPNQTDSKSNKLGTASTRNIKSAPAKKDIKREPGKVVVGRTASGTDYIRINLKPDHLYPDKGMANHEKLIDAAKLAAINPNKPISLSIGGVSNEKKLTPSSSPKPSRHVALQKEAGGSRSPSPLNLISSRKSSISSLFKSRECPESPGEKARSRSKSRDKSTPQSQTGTPNKQKSVLAIFKPKRSGSRSKCSSPIDAESIGRVEVGNTQPERSVTPSENRSRPASRLRYYDAPADGSIYIPLHTPPEEKDTRKLLLQEIEAKLQERRPQSAPVVRTPLTTPNQNETAVVIERPPPTIPRPHVISAPSKPPPPPPPSKSPKPPQLEKLQRIENLDAIQTLPQDVSDVERTWSLEVQRHSSQDSQETVASDNSGSITSRVISKPSLPNVIENPIKEVPTENNQKSEENNQKPEVVPNNVPAKDKRKILFATKIGSGSQEQIFSTQFSLSKTESLTSQLSEHASIPESPAQESSSDHLSRQDTVIRREDSIVKKPPRISRQKIENAKVTASVVTPLSTPAPVGTVSKHDSSEEKQSIKSKANSEEDDHQSITVLMRRKNSEDQKRKSRSASEDDDGSHRHSKYLENFDVRKKLHENVIAKRHSGRHSSDSSIKEQNSRSSSKEDPDVTIAQPQIPEKTIRQVTATTLPAAAYDRESVVSTDDLAGSSESERDSEMDPNRVRRHLPRHVTTIEDHESTGLVSQDSYDEELPYIPTTLPEERAQGVSIIPMKERVHMELKTCPLDRPRSTTPLNPSSLEEYCGTNAPEVIDHSHHIVRGEKLRISLPRKDTVKENPLLTKSPRRASNSSGKSWFEFAEQGLRGATTSTSNSSNIPRSTEQTSVKSNTTVNQNYSNKGSDSETHQRPTLPPRKPSGQWIDFENIPEKRKAPKRITALPKESPKDPKLTMQQYNYVKPEDCQCECHESERDSSVNKSITSVDLLQQGEDMQPLLDSETHEGIEPSDSSMEGDEATQRNLSNDSIQQHGQRSSSRSSGHSQDEETTTPLRCVQNSRNRKYHENHRYS